MYHGGKADVRFPKLSLIDLLPFSGPVPKDYLLMIFKSYFDGGNQADSTQYDVLTLASVSGTLDMWKLFERDWKAVLIKHRAPFLHTTDAVSLLREPFTRDNGWDEDRRDAFLLDCVTVVDNHIGRPRTKTMPARVGLVPYTVTIVLDDFLKARKVNPAVPKTATELCATQAAWRCVDLGYRAGANFFHLVFDQGEPFMGHIHDRMRNKKARKHLKILNRITSLTEADMRLFPAIQMADLFAWCISHKNSESRFKWQNRILAYRKWIDEWFTYEHMAQIKPETADLVNSWNLPPRRATR